jgi:hypothetical protein
VSFDVSADEPSASFSAAAHERLPGVDVRRAAAEQLPFPDGTFDAALAQLVVHFMTEGQFEISATVWAVTCQVPAPGAWS